MSLLSRRRNILPIGGSSLFVGMVAEWLMNNNGNDTSGNGYNLTTLDGATFVTDRNLNPASSLHMVTGNSPEYPFSSVEPRFEADATLSLWIKNDVNIPASSADAGGMSFSDNSGNTSYPYTNGVAYITTFRDTVNRVSFGLPALDKSNWHMVTVTSTPGSNGYKFYQNTTLIAQFAGLSAIYLGDKFICSDRTNAAFDDVRLWNRALSPDEITELYNLG